MHELLKRMINDRCTEDFYEWLLSIGYFECPAAKSHHGNYRGGLYDHSLQVAKELQVLTDKLGLTWEDPSSPYVIGLLHDICKTDDYKYNFGDTSDIRWDPEHSGHGMKSIVMLAGHIDLTEEEKYCIIYHMGAFTDKDDWKYYNKAIKKYPNVLYTHMADMIASQIKGV